jgi:N-acetylneuraminic acid mutarotase/photosystem II stability/assembly factor-like uncharacterized protein
MKKFTQVLLLVATLCWLPADWLMTTAAAQTTPVPTDATTDPATIRMQKRMEAMQRRNEHLTATRTRTNTTTPEKSLLNAPQGKWEPRAPLPTGPRERTINFTIGNKFYVAAGRGLPGWAVRSLNETDVWAYDFSTDTWEELNPFPGGGIRNCASFVIDGIAYIVTGHSSSHYIDVFWKYDPSTDTWQELPPFPGGRRSWPAAFALNGKGYVTTGGIGPDVPDSTFYYTDVWEFDPVVESWTQLGDFPGAGRWRSFSFVIDGYAYVGGGNQDGSLSSDYSDCYRFDPADGTWTPIADFPEGWGLGGYAVTIDGKGYVGEGANDEYFDRYGTRLWEYDPLADSWTHVSNTPGYQAGRMFAFSSAYNGKLYVGGGRMLSWAALSPMFGDFHVWDKNLEPAPNNYEYWERSGRSDVDENLIGVYGIRAISEDTLWALPAPNLTFSTAALQVMFSSNGGQSWETFTADDHRGYYSAHFHAPDSRNVWVMGTLLNGYTNVFRTQDGGQTWEQIFDSADNLMPESSGIHFFNDDVGLCWGNDFFDDLRLFVYRTEDGGQSWQLLDNPELPGSFSFEWSFNTSANNNYAAMGDTIWIPVDYIMIRSTDRGATWSRVDFNMSIYSVAFEDALRGMTISDNWPDTTFARAFVTEDGGATWTEVSQPSPAVISVNHIPGRPGAYVAYSTIQCDPHIAYTPNYGQDWFEIYAPPALHAIQFLSQDLAFAGGPLLRDVPEGVYRWRGDLSVFNRLYVKADATGANTGRTWADAFTDLQSALAIAEPDQEIWVAQGTYTPAGPGGARTATFLVNKELHLYGGFAGTESSLDERGDPTDYPTILSGDLNGDDVEGELLINRTDNCFTIMTLTAAISTKTTVDGFVFRSGHADGPGAGPDKVGAGLYNLGKPVINGCVFEQNYALQTGGGLSFVSSTSGGEILNCIFRQNAANSGGGLSCFANLYQIEDCIFEDNFTFPGAFQAHGGGAYIVNGNGSIQNCRFNNNSSVASGGGIFKWCTMQSIGVTFNISGSTFLENSAATGGGLSFVPWGDDAVYSVDSCRFEANNSSNNGGGLYVVVNPNASDFQLSVEDCHFESNQTINNGSASYVEVRGQNATIEIEGCEYTDNVTENFSAAGAFWATGNGTGIALVENCHFENNSSTYSGAVEMGVGFNGGGNFVYEVINSSFVSNEAMEGGGLTLWTDQTSTGSFLVDNCIFDGNIGTMVGGGILLHPHSTNFQATVKNSFITNNQSPDGSGIKAFPFLNLQPFPTNAQVHIENSLVEGNAGSPTAISVEFLRNFSLLNITVAGNEGGGVEIGTQSNIRLQNTILYNPGHVEYAAVGVNNSFTSAGGNLIGDLSLDGQLLPGDKQNLDPLFEGAGSFQLTLASPCVDAGVDAGVTAPFDLAGNPRIQGLRVDMGAYESPFTTSATETAANEEAALWPNPATDVLNIVLPGSETATFEVQVFDAAGKMLLRRRLWPGQALPLQGLSAGMYTLKAITAGRIYTGQFIKQ